MQILIGNTFPLGLIRVPVTVTPVTVQKAKALLEDATEVVSFWGHGDTIQAAKELLGMDVTPLETRPVVSLDEEDFPSLYGKSFDLVVVLSPVYKGTFRPEPGTEVASHLIDRWEAKLIDFISHCTYCGEAIGS